MPPRKCQSSLFMLLAQKRLFALDERGQATAPKSARHRASVDMDSKVLSERLLDRDCCGCFAGCHEPSAILGTSLAKLSRAAAWQCVNTLLDASSHPSYS